MPTEQKDHIVRSFDEKLRDLRGRVLAMAATAEAQVSDAVRALLTRDRMLAAQVTGRDPALDRMEREIEEAVVLLLALRQPVAIDLRGVVAALKIAKDLERIGDHAKSVARRAGALAALPPTGSMNGFERLAERVKENLRRGLGALEAGDARAARDAWAADEGVDETYNGIVRELLTHMMEDPRSIGPATQLMFAAKSLERIGDHATNVAEAVHFAAIGSALPNERPQADTTGG
jgi:phosphate transport system protein